MADLEEVHVERVEETVAGSSSCQGLSDSSILFKFTKPIKRKKSVRAASGVVLSEDDVPGAKLADKDPSKLKVKDLDRWLICRNLSTKGNKAEKVERINGAIAHEAQFGPLEIVDPDEGSHLAKKPAVVANVSTNPLLEELATPGWVFTTQWSEIPHALQQINISHLNTYYHKKSAGTDLSKGQLLASSGKILASTVAFKMSNGLLLAKFRCTASMKCFDYQGVVAFQVEPNLKIFRGHCSCVAGLGGLCCHLSAFVHFLIAGKKANKDNSVPCTSKLCEWVVPTNQSKAVLVSDVVPIRPDLNRDKPRKRSFEPKAFDPLVFDSLSTKEYVDMAISHLSKIEGSYAQLLFSTMQKLPSSTNENEK